MIVERLRLTDDIRMILERHFFREYILPDIAPEDVRVSVYDMLTKKYDQKFSTLEESIRATVIKGQNASLLGVAHGAPGFLMFFMARNRDEDPRYFAEVIYRGDVRVPQPFGPIRKRCPGMMNRESLTQAERGERMKNSNDIMHAALRLGVGLPAFNIAHLAMTEPVIRAVVDQDSFALVEVSRIDCVKFGARSSAAVMDEYRNGRIQAM